MQSNRKLSIQIIFITVQAILYVGFLALDLTNKSYDISVILKYSIILLCFCYALLSAGKSTFYLLQTALLFTAISDLFILILDYYFFGVLTFILAQEFYSLRLVILSNKIRSAESSVGHGKKLCVDFLKRILLQLTVSLTVCLLLVLAGVKLEGLLMISVFYFICIVTNVVSAFTLARHQTGNKGHLIYAFGMLLFLLCDINVGIFNLSGFISMSGEVYEVLYTISSILMWTFYAPAQILIAISSSYEEGRKFDISHKNL
jgi:hypothetical protein